PQRTPCGAVVGRDDALLRLVPPRRRGIAGPVLRDAHPAAGLGLRGTDQRSPVALTGLAVSSPGGGRGERSTTFGRAEQLEPAVGTIRNGPVAVGALTGH